MANTINCYIGNVLPSDAKPTQKAVNYGCHACEYIKDNSTVKCSSFVGVSGRDPQSEDVYKDEWKCCEEWKVIMMLEVGRTTLTTTTAIESFRNESVKHHDQALHIAAMNAQNLPLNKEIK